MQRVSFSLGYTIETVDLPSTAKDPFMTAIISNSGKYVFRKWHKTEKEAEEGHREIAEDFEKDRGKYLDHILFPV